MLIKNFINGAWLLRLGVGIGAAIVFEYPKMELVKPNMWAQAPTVNLSPETSQDFYQLCQEATVRVVKPDSAGSGVIIHRHQNVYSVLTNWHVIDSSEPMILTVDSQEHPLVESPRQLGDTDLAILKFSSESRYLVASTALSMPKVGERVYAAGFPLIIDGVNSMEWGRKAFRLNPGRVTLVPTRSLPLGYQIGYTNETAMGMSGSPIFNQSGALIAIHGRGKYRDPSFGVYVFADGTEPNPTELEQMIQSSWGIPVAPFFKLLD